MDSNVGFNLFVATTKLLNFHCPEGEGCEIIWSFVVKPVQGWKLDDLVSFCDSALQTMAKQMEEAL